MSVMNDRILMSIDVSPYPHGRYYMGVNLARIGCDVKMGASMEFIYEEFGFFA